MRQLHSSEPFDWWMRGREWIDRVPPSAARNGHAFSSGSEQAGDQGLAQDGAALPSLPDLLDELDTDVDIASLEQLTQSLLQDIARDLEAAAEKTDAQVSFYSMPFWSVDFLDNVNWE